MPAATAASGLGGDGDQPPVRIGDAGRPQPVERRPHVRQRFGGGEGLRDDDDQGRRRIERSDRIVERLAVDVRQETHVEPRRAPAERIDQQRRPEHRAADADVQHARDIAERARFDRIDQRARALPPSSREIDVVGSAAAALGDMGRRPAFARVDDLAGEQSVARRGETHPLRARHELARSGSASRCVFDQSK